MSYQKPWFSFAAILFIASLMTACGGGGGGNGVTDVTHSGSVGDGPITGATVIVRDKNGVILATETSDNTANYQITLKVPKESYPLQIVATGGIDTVTQSEPDFSLVSVATDPSQSKANINPFSTLITRMALAMPGGLTDANINTAKNTVISNFGFGFDSTLIPDPIRTPVTESNVAAVVKASETLGEAVRRSRDALLIQGESVSGDNIMNAIAADMVDGTMDGMGASGSDPRTAAVVSVVAGQVLIEAMSNRLKVGGVDATQAMDDAIRISLPDAPPTSVTKNVRIPKNMIEQTQRAVAAARALAPDAALSTIAAILPALPSDALPSDIEQLLPGDTSSDLNSAISGAIFATGTQLGDINTVARNFTDVGTSTDTGTGTDTGAGTGTDTGTGSGTAADAGAGAAAVTQAESRRRNRNRNRNRAGTGTGAASGSTGTAAGTGTGAGTSASTDNQPLASSDSASTNMNQKITVAVLNNDSGLQDTPLDVTVSGKPAHGTVSINGNNAITYTPDADYSGQENFSYRVTDADGDVSLATVTINVICASGCTEAASKVTLTWNPSPGDVLGYRVRYGTTAGNATREISDVAETTVTYDIADDLALAPGDRVCFRVLAYNASGTSAPSDAVCGAI